MFRFTSCFGVVLVVLAGTGEVLAASIPAGVLASHYDSTDPNTEGWSDPSPAGEGPVFDDEGYDAWQIVDTVITSSVYMHDLSPDEVSAATTDGWKFTTRLKAVSGTMGTAFYTGSTRYVLKCTVDVDGDPIVDLFGHETVVLDGYGSGYHLYELTFSPATETAVLLVDGNTISTGYQGETYTTIFQQLHFGTGWPGAGTSRWNLVEFETVPEPSTLALLAMGTVGLLAYVWRRRNIR